MGDDGARAKKYRKMADQRSHVLLRPGMYVGSTDTEELPSWVLRFTEAGELRLERQTVSVSPALFKVYDELVTNALDASVKDPLVKTIKINITPTTISCKNDGEGIPVEIHPEFPDTYVPTLVFGHLLTSTNYDDEDESAAAVAGTNGLGIKLANILSSWFSVSVADAKTGITFDQEWRDSMEKAADPKVKPAKKAKKKDEDEAAPSAGKTRAGHVKVEFRPLPRLLPEGGEITEPIVALFAKRALDLALAVRKGVSITFNGQKLPCSNLRTYCKLLGDDVVMEESECGNWRVAAVSVREGERPDVHGLVNGASSIGKHVTYVAGNVASALTPVIKKKRGGKDISVTQSTLLNNCHLVVVAQVLRPVWSSQVKRELDKCDYITRYKPSEDFVKKLAASSVAEAIISAEGAKAAAAAARKTDGKKVATLNIPKLRDAKWAGTNKSKQTTIFFTEGDSAMTFAVAALEKLGFDTHGAFPLKGKILNTREASPKQIAGNAEITNIKKILGLQDGVDSADGLRYGRCVILSDQDADGAHIRGLFLNFIHDKWPNIAKSGFICVVPTPIVRVQRGATVKDFFSTAEYKTWDDAENRSGWRVRYYKGLGGWTSADAREILKNTAPVRFVGSDETDSSVELAFSKKKVEDRKKWIMDTVASTPEPLAYTRDIPIHVFINSDLALFSVYSVQRSVPTLMDGFKPSQTKVIHTVLDGGFTSASKRIKTAQLGARTAEKTHYQHGEKSLFETITGLCQGFAGANNIPVMFADGQFGSRLENGKDSASERYTHTFMSAEGRALFHDDDLPLLTYNYEDGHKVEPVFFLPVLPLILINGVRAGIATGFSTYLPPFKPSEVLANVRRFLSGDQFQPMTPWYRGFQGTVEPTDAECNKFRITGKWTVSGDKVTITELPVGVSFNDFAEALKDEKSIFHLVTNESSEERPRMVLKFKNADKAKEVLETEGGLFKVLELSRDISLKNMHLFGVDGAIKKYSSPFDILKEYCEFRLQRYSDRLEYLIGKLSEQISVLENKHRYVEEVRTEKISLSGQDEASLQALLQTRGFSTHSGSYDYLLNIPSRAFTINRAAALSAELQTAKDKRAALQAKDGKQLWSEDLVEVEKVLPEER